MDEWICDVCGNKFKIEVDLLAHQFNSPYERELQKREQAAALAKLREFATAARDARIAMTFYREWMLTHGEGETRYPFGVDAERTLAALEQETK